MTRPRMRDGLFAVHVALTAVMAWLAVALAAPNDTFGSSAAYRAMARLGSETGWAMAFWAAACLGVAGLCTPSRWLRLLSVLALATMNGLVALCFATGNPTGTGAGTYAVLAGLGYYLAWRRSDEGV